MTPFGRPPRMLAPARLGAAAILLVAIAAACGSSGATPSKSVGPASPSASFAGGPDAALASSPSISPSAPAVTPAPTISIVPVPTSQLAAPTAYSAHLDDATAKALQTALNTARTGGNYPGVSAAVIFPDGSMWTGVSGKAVTVTGVPVATGTLFSVGSISKTFIAALIGRLVQAGTLGLEDHLSKYVPTFPNAAKISLRQLLNHTAGIRDLFDRHSTLPADVLANPSTAWTAAQVLATIGKPYTAPGKGYHYSNTDYVLLGMVIEKATGKKVAALVRSNFLTPLGMKHTYLQTEEQAKGPEAHGYMPGRAGTCAPCDNSAGTMIPFTAEATVAGFAGAYVSTASDLAIWANALYGGYVLSESALASMVDISPSIPFKPHYPYGMGFEEIPVSGQVAWGHRGRLDGFCSAMEYLPASHVTVVFLTNADWAATKLMGPVAALMKAAQGGG